MSIFSDAILLRFNFLNKKCDHSGVNVAPRPHIRRPTQHVAGRFRLFLLKVGVHNLIVKLAVSVKKTPWAEVALLDIYLGKKEKIPKLLQLILFYYRKKKNSRFVCCCTARYNFPLMYNNNVKISRCWLINNEPCIMMTG